MIDDKAFERKLKTQVRGPNHRWHLICTPGFEEILAHEAESKGLKLLETGKGFVEVEARLQAVAHFSLFTQVANRIYLTMAEFHAGATEELFKKVKKLPWSLWLGTKAEIVVRTLIGKSRIKHEGRVADLVLRAIKRSVEEFWAETEQAPDFEPETARVLVRILENTARLRLDMSGDLHYRRGYKKAITKAPLRESLAASLYLWARQGLSDQGLIVYDPFCGSGSFGSEALIELSKAGGGRGRSFKIFEVFGTSAAGSAFEYRNAKAKIDPSDQIKMSDLDPEAAAVAQANLDALGRIIETKAPVVECKDFFDIVPDPREKKLVLINPPWGLRLEASDTDLVAQIQARLQSHWQGSRVLLLAPRETVKIPPSARQKDLVIGGQKILALVYDS